MRASRAESRPQARPRASHDKINLYYASAGNMAEHSRGGKCSTARHAQATINQSLLNIHM